MKLWSVSYRKYQNNQPPMVTSLQEKALHWFPLDYSSSKIQKASSFRSLAQVLSEFQAASFTGFVL